MAELLKNLNWQCDIGPYSLESLDKIMDSHTGSKMVVFIPKKPIHLPKRTEVHPDYAFIIPLTMPLNLSLEKKEIILKKNRILASNCYEEYGATADYSNIRFIGIHIAIDFVEDSAYSIFGKSKFFFKRECAGVNSELYNLIWSFVEESTSRQTGCQFVLESLSTHIMVKLFRQMKSNMPNLLSERNYTEKVGINRVINYFIENYNERFSLEDVSRLAGLSAYHFIRVFKTYTGMTPHEYLQDIRISKAREMLKTINLSITDIAGLCGFYSPNHFATVFRRKVGASPSEYRRQI